MNIPTTGIPELDAAVAWLLAGGTLSTTGAVGVVALIVRYVAVPAVKWVMKKRQKPLTPVGTVYMAGVSGVIVTIFLGFITKSALPMQQMIVMGLAAIGWHQIGKQTALAGRMLHGKTMVLPARIAVPGVPLPEMELQPDEADNPSAVEQQ